MQDVLLRLDKAMKAFFRRVKAGETPGYPRFKSRDRYASFCYPDSAGWKLAGNRLHLTKLGTVKVKLPRRVEGTIKTCTIKREGGSFYVVFAVEVGLTPRLASSDETVGIDLGTLRLATVSTGDTIENPRHSRCAEQKLKTLHKQARGLVDTYDTLVFEDLSSSNMRRRPKPKQDDDGTSLGLFVT